MKNLALKFNLKRSTFVIFVCVTVIAIVMQTPKKFDAKEVLEFNRDLTNYNAKLQIVDLKDRQLAEFKIAIAESDHQKMYGLMNLDYLPSNYGMLFPFPQKQMVAMWMKNTRIPLDMLFIDENDKIVTIKTNAKPYSLDLIPSEKEVTKVLEINAGLAKKLKIKTGQKVKIL